jgi:hypothetical protein
MGEWRRFIIFTLRALYPHGKNHRYTFIRGWQSSKTAQDNLKYIKILYSSRESNLYLSAIGHQNTD